MRYVKLIDNKIEYAPKNKGSILNYDLDIEQMLADGYKPFVEIERPQTNRFYHIEYSETDTQISEVLVYDETQEEADEREVHEEDVKVANLSMRRGDVFEALILARGITKAQIRTMIEQAELDEITKALYLNRFDEALEFYRKFPLFDLLGQALGVTSEQLDNFFITKNYEFLKVVEVPAEKTSGDNVADEGETIQNEGE